MRRSTLDHVQVAIPAGGEDEARRYFGELLGLPEIPKPAEQAGRGGCWFGIGEHQLHLGVDPDFRPARKAHVAIATTGLHELKGRMVEAGYEVRDEVPLGGRARFFSTDPFGNRIEFVAAQGR
jgi:extradiol dioxygenase family protein